MRSLILNWIILLLFLPTTKTYSYTYHFRNYSVKDGLPFIHVYAIFQDSRGFLWSGGYGGLSRFDGFTFTNYAPKDGLADHWITSITEDRKGNLWIGTIRGLNKFDGKKFTTYTVADNIPGNRINHTLIDRDGYLWLATNKGICRFGENSTLVYNTKSGLINDTVDAIFQDNKGDIWLGTRSGITVFDGMNFRNFPAKEAQCIRSVNAFLEEDDGTIWIGTSTGLCRYNGNEFTAVSFPYGKKSTCVTALAPNPFGKGFWIGTTTGLFLYDETGMNQYPIRGTANSQWVECIFNDYEGNLWLGTYAGLYKYRGNAFQVYSTGDGLINNFVFPVFRDHSGQLWVGTDDGLYLQRKDTFIMFTVEHGLPGNRIHSITEDSQRYLWITTDSGIVRCRTEYFLKKFPPLEYYSTHEGLISMESYDLFCDSKGKMWIGGKDGLSVFDPFSSQQQSGKKFRSFPIKKGTEELSVRAFAEDSDGRIFAGAYNGGLFLKTDSGFIDYGSIIGLPTVTVLVLICDKSNNLWIGSLDGVFCYDGKKIKAINERNGLNSDLVYSMIMDESETRIWIGTNQGLNKMDVPEFLKGETPEIEHYGEEEGFYGVECNPGVFLDVDGSKWFATVNGLIKFNPGEYIKNTMEPKLHITGIKIHYKDTDAIQILPYYLNHISFRFTGICMTNPGKVLYSYRLENYDRHWSPPSPLNMATYSNLPPGKYAFTVKACNNEYIWNSTPLRYEFAITTPFWKRQWFRVSMALLVILLLLAFFFIRMQQIRKRNELQRKMDTLKLQALRAQMNPHFIFNALNAIQQFINTNEKRRANDYLAKFSDLIRKVLENSGKNTVPLSDDLRALELYIQLEEMRFENRFDYAITVDKNTDTEYLPVPPMILQPYVENAIRHGLLNLEAAVIVRRGKLTINIRQDGDYIHCIIEDNGVGRKKSAELKSPLSQKMHVPLGMDITRQRMETLGKLNRRSMSRIQITDLTDEKGIPSGTRIELQIPIGWD